MSILKRYGDTDFVTGMRALAALMVVLIHTGGAGLRSFGETGNNIVNLGATGVIVFFVISGFSISASYDKAASFRAYFTARLWRILPLFYFWLFFMWAWKALYEPSLASYLASKIHLLSADVDPAASLRRFQRQGPDRCRMDLER